MSGLAAGTRIRSTLLLAAAALPLLLGATRAAAVCVGDCGGDGRVGIADVQACVNLANDLAGIACPNADQNGDGEVDVVDVDNCILSFLDASTCPQVAATPTLPPGTSTPVNTATPVNTSTPPNTNTPLNTSTPVSTNTAPATATPPATSTATSIPTATRTNTPLPSATPTLTPAPPCPLQAGSYTLTQVAGGSLAVNGFAPFPFPAGGAITMDIATATQPNCIHEGVIGFPNGFSAPNFCIPALGFVTSITQTGCGVGRIDSNGGSDFTVREIGDTSDSSPVCNIKHTNCSNGFDSKQRVDITVGDGVTDVCTGGGTGNAIVAVPVFTVTWLDTSGGPQVLPPCNGDGIKQPSDLLITQFPQILDFTTDSNKADWQDIDGDGCFLAGAGPAAGFTASGQCMNLTTGVVTTGAAGTIGSNGAPTFDLSFSSTLPNIVAGPNPLAGVTCASPPAINFTGAATRCLGVTP